MMDRSSSNMILYRPVGLEELELMYDSGMQIFPARLPQQPIFYPVLDLEYARQTASDWNAKNGQFAGYVTEFKVEEQYINRFEKHTVGGSHHQEYWIPAEELEEFNRHISGHIKVVEAHFGKSFKGFVPDQFGLQGKNAVAQFTELANIFVNKRMEFYLEIKRNHKAIFLNYPFWLTHKFKNEGLTEKVLQAIKDAWLTSFPRIPLPMPVPEDAPPREVDAESPVTPVPQDTPPIKQVKSPYAVKPVHRETPPVRQTDSKSPVKPVPPQTPSIKQKYVRPAENPPAKPVKPSAPVIPIEKEIPPPRQAEPSSGTDPREEEVSPVEDGNPLSAVERVDEQPAPVQKTDIYRFGNRVPRDTARQQQKEARFEQGIRLGIKGEFLEAVKELSAAVAERPNDVVARTSLGVAYHRLGEDDRALSCYEAALEREPKLAEAYYFRANILYSRADVREAMAGYTTAIGLDPGLIDAHQQPMPQDRLTDYTSTPAEMYRVARAAHRILDLDKALEANPRQASLFKERAAEYARLGNYERAIADYDAALKIQPEDPDTLHQRGLAYERSGQTDRAQADYQQAVAANSQLSDMYIDRGVSMGRMGNFRQSIVSLSEGIRLAPQNPNGYFNRGTSYFQLGDLENAIADFSRVIELSSRDEDAYFWRGISHEEMGNRQKAIEDYRQFLKVSQNPHAREEIEYKLSQWNVDAGESASSPKAVPVNKPKADPVQPEKPERKLDLYDLIAALGERAVLSTWFASDVDCDGEKAEELYAHSDHQRPIEGGTLLQITSGIRRTFEGDFQAFDPGGESHWLLLRAWEGNGFYIETDDPKVRKLLQTQFQQIEEVEGAAPPYEGLFIQT